MDENRRAFDDFCQKKYCGENTASSKVLTSKRREKFLQFLRGVKSPEDSRHKSRIKTQRFVLLNDQLYQQQERLGVETFLKVPCLDEFYDIINEVHEEIGHNGVQKTYHSLQTRYSHIPRIAVDFLIKRCLLCQLKRDRRKQAPIKRIKSSRPSQRYQELRTLSPEGVFGVDGGVDTAAGQMRESPIRSDDYDSSGLKDTGSPGWTCDNVQITVVDGSVTTFTSTATQTQKMDISPKEEIKRKKQERDEPHCTKQFLELKRKKVENDKKFQDEMFEIERQKLLIYEPDGREQFLELKRKKVENDKKIQDEMLEIELLSLGLKRKKVENDKKFQDEMLEIERQKLSILHNISNAISSGTGTGAISSQSPLAVSPIKILSKVSNCF